MTLSDIRNTKEVSSCARRNEVKTNIFNKFKKFPWRTRCQGPQSFVTSATIYVTVHWSENRNVVHTSTSQPVLEKVWKFNLVLNNLVGAAFKFATTFNILKNLKMALKICKHGYILKYLNFKVLLNVFFEYFWSFENIWKTGFRTGFGFDFDCRENNVLRVEYPATPKENMSRTLISCKGTEKKLWLSLCVL